MVVVCKPLKTGLNICTPPEHNRRYSMTIPFGCEGRFQLSMIDREPTEIPMNPTGGDPTPVWKRDKYDDTTLP